MGLYPREAFCYHYSLYSAHYLTFGPFLMQCTVNDSVNLLTLCSTMNRTLFCLRHASSSVTRHYSTMLYHSLGMYCHCRISKGVSKAYKMAISDFTNTSLTSSCIIFTELLSQDSTKLRVHLATARRLLKHHTQFANDSDSIC